MSSVLASDARSEPAEQIIAAAEMLLASGGPQRATVRAITQAAGVNVAAINYHFGSRDGLMLAICARHMRHANEEIIRQLDALEVGEGPDAVREIFTPLVSTALSVWMRDDVLKGLRDFIFVDAALAEKLNVSEMSAVYQRMHDALRQACPALTPDDVRRRFRFAMAVIMQVVRARASNGSGEEGERFVDELLTFLAGGFCL